MEDLFEQASISYEEKVFIAEQFLDTYEIEHARDMYRWLWEGEFGPGSQATDPNLESLAQDIRHARMHARRSRREFPHLCEDIGLARKFLKINLVPYADSGCPLQRLIALMERMKDARPDPLRFKKDWAFTKTQIYPGLPITIDKLNHFENEIAFHMSPEIEYSEEFLEKYGNGYRIVPRNLFFQYFPEYAPENSGWL